MKILIFGRSNHLAHLITLAFPNADISIIPWRGSGDKTDRIHGQYFDKIFVVGYDYSTYLTSIDNLYSNNVRKPLEILRSCSHSKTEVIYINTAFGKKSFTFSRYRFAKESLAYAILKEFKAAYIIRLNTFSTYDGSPLIKGGLLQRALFKIASRMKIISFSTPDEILNAINNRDSINNLTIALNAKFLSLPRSQLIDRILRMTLG